MVRCFVFGEVSGFWSCMGDERPVRRNRRRSRGEIMDRIVVAGALSAHVLMALTQVLQRPKEGECI